MTGNSPSGEMKSLPVRGWFTEDGDDMSISSDISMLIYIYWFPESLGTRLTHDVWERQGLPTTLVVHAWSRSITVFSSLCLACLFSTFVRQASETRRRLARRSTDFSSVRRCDFRETNLHHRIISSSTKQWKNRGLSPQIDIYRWGNWESLSHAGKVGRLTVDWPWWFSGSNPATCTKGSTCSRAILLM